jgi:hypothetical protein
MSSTMLKSSMLTIENCPSTSCLQFTIAEEGTPHHSAIPQQHHGSRDILTKP